MAREVGEYQVSVGFQESRESSASGSREQPSCIKYHYKGDEDESQKVSIECGSMKVVGN